jgi:vacuolar-type H+-ATPase subunit C/Vma6
MDRSAANAYVYAKVCGMLSKSYVGERAAKLFSVKSLNELWGLLFAEEVPAVPETLLARQIEKKSEEKFISEYIKLVSCYSKPAKLLVNLLRSYDYENIKEIGAALCFKENKLPEVVDIGSFSEINYDEWPNIAKMTENSAFAWYNKIPDIHEQQLNDTKLDQQFVYEIFTAIKELPAEERNIALSLFKEEYILQNIVWVMRLRVYYGLEKEDILARLAYTTFNYDVADEIASPAIKIVDYPVDSYSEWAEWEYKDLLNPNEEGVVWNLDPRWFEGEARKKVCRSAEKLLHRYPDSVGVLLCFFKMKSHELDCIRSIAEGLKMSVDAGQIMLAAGVNK